MTRTKHRPRSKPSAPEYLGGIEPEPERKLALALPPKISVQKAKELMPWSNMTEDQLQGEIDAVWAFSASLAAQISQTDQGHVNWMLSDDPTDESRDWA